MMASTREPIVKLSNVRFSWPGQDGDLLHICRLEIEKGEHLLIRGSSGSGKTTLLNLLTGISQPRSGSVEILATPLESLSHKQRDEFRADHLGVIFQQFNLLPYLSVMENAMLPCWFSRRRRENAGEVMQATRRLFDALNVSVELANQPVSKLSVGQQQRVAVVRALIGNPEIVIADEPTSALDTDNRDRFLQLLFREADHRGSTLIFVSHDPHIANQFSRVLEMSEINHARPRNDT
jgi:putative ABC transport system ATP-binding protein